MARGDYKSTAGFRKIWSQPAEKDLKARVFTNFEGGGTLTMLAPIPTLCEPFGDERNAQVQYRTMHWWQAGMIMVAETISLGILSLPSVLAGLGFVP